jgi:hypothetical protein
MGVCYRSFRYNYCWVLNGTAIFGRGSVVVGALALVITLLARQRIEKKKLKPELALELR